MLRTVLHTRGRWKFSLADIEKKILQEGSMVKKPSCVSCGSLKRFPHTFTINIHFRLLAPYRTSLSSLLDVFLFYQYLAFHIRVVFGVSCCSSKSIFMEHLYFHTPVFSRDFYKTCNQCHH